MITVDQQLHGYRQGHQLLASTLDLDKIDQDLVDRLSDMAGPLRPGETFQPYLTGYPLPSGSFYVLARTWQDLKVKRAGCVRTMSLFIPIKDWASAPSLSPFVAILNGDSLAPSRLTVEINAESASPLPKPTEFHGAELIEALFLEVRKPIVAFDIPDPELVTERLMTALWPAFRCRFAVSTFALSPRKLSGRSFDLVFAPKDARPRFVDWNGRRIDGRGTSAPARHRWTDAIAASVFAGDVPELLSGNAHSLLSADESGSEEALRIAILWRELQEKLNSTPLAILGLLDIANTRVKRDVAAIHGLEPALAQAAIQAVATMPAAEAWTFLDALTRKLHDLPVIPSSSQAIGIAVVQLAANDPVSAIKAVAQGEERGLAEVLVSSAGDGLSQSLTHEAVAALESAPPSTLVRLLLGSQALAERALSEATNLHASLARALPLVEAPLLEGARQRLLRLLVDERHVQAAEFLISGLNREGLLDEVQYLYDANRLAAPSFFPLIAKQAHKIGAVIELRDAVAALAVQGDIDSLLAATLRRSADDVAWLTSDSQINEPRRSDLLLRLLRTASSAELRVMLFDQTLLERVIMQLLKCAESTDVLQQLILEVPMPIELRVATVLRLLVTVRGLDAARLATLSLERCLPVSFGGDELSTIKTLFSIAGDCVNGTWLIRWGVEPGVRADIASRNLIAFEKAPPAVKVRILEAVEDLARTIEARNILDISKQAVEACAAIFWDAKTIDARAALRASLQLLPFLLRARQHPASPLIAAVFPQVYLELRRGSEAPDILRLFLFIDWDRCKVARDELVDAFMDSTWNPGDLALAGARADDAVRILKRIARSKDGDHFMETIKRDLGSIPPPWRDIVSSALYEVRPGPSTLPEGNA